MNYYAVYRGENDVPYYVTKGKKYRILESRQFGKFLIKFDLDDYYQISNFRNSVHLQGDNWTIGLITEHTKELQDA